MKRFKGVLKCGVCMGLALTLMLSGTSCGKKEIEVDDYGVESDLVSDDISSFSESNTEAVKSDGRSLTEIFGDNISVDESFSAGTISADFKLAYKVPEVDQINVYEGKFVGNDSETEKQIVNNFFGGTEKNLDEIKYENEADYIPLLYKYRSILLAQKLGTTVDYSSAITPDIYSEYMSNIDSSFDKVYKWADEVNYYIHMYEGEYNGNRYGMIYYYDKASCKKNIYISPISIAEYFPETDIKTMFVVDQKSDFETENMCSMSEEDIKKEAGDVVEKLGLNDKDIVFSLNPGMAIFEIDGMSTYVDEATYNEMPKLVFTDSDLMSAAMNLNAKNPTGRTYTYKLLKEQQDGQPGQADTENVKFTENGYAVYLCSEPFSGNVVPQLMSSFNRGSIFYTDKGLYSVDISLVAQIDNVVEGVQLLSFDNIKESFKKALENDPDISKRSSASLEVNAANFTYVLIEAENNSGKVTYVPAWVFTTKDNKLKAGEQALTYMHVINAIDGSDLRDAIR